MVEEDKYYIALSINDNIKRDDYTVYMLEVIPETIGQYTGLHDKYGKEIYDGDDVYIISDNESATIKWDEEIGKFIICVEDSSGKYARDEDFDYYNGNELEVI